MYGFENNYMLADLGRQHYKAYSFRYFARYFVEKG